MMSAYDSVQVSEWLRDGIAAARAGRRDEARELLMRVVEANESSEQGWIWLSGVVDTDEDRLICLENALTLNPDNAQARAGLKWLQGQGVGSREQGIGSGEQASSSTVFQTTVERDADFLTAEGCVYCGLVVDDEETRCPHCGRLLVSRQFKRQERSAWAYQLHALWIILGLIIIVEALLIRFDWTKAVDSLADGVPTSLAPIVNGFLYDVASTLVHPGMTGDTGLEATVIFIVLLGMGGLGLLLAPALLLRQRLAHIVGRFLIIFHLLFEVALLARGVTGLGLGALQGIYTIVLALLMYETIEDFALVERREWLELDRHAINATDFYGRGRIYEKRGQWARALLHWQKAAALSPANDAYPAAMAQVCARLGRLELALKHIDRALEISPNPQDLRHLREIIVEMQNKT
jgi:tetratricopeptide (TPR) repeat protein